MPNGGLNVGDNCHGVVVCNGISGIGHLTEGLEQVIFEIREFHLEGTVSHINHIYRSSLTFYIYYITKIFSCQVGAGVLLIRFRAGAYTPPLYYNTKINLCQMGQEVKDSCRGWGGVWKIRFSGGWIFVHLQRIGGWRRYGIGTQK